MFVNSRNGMGSVPTSTIIATGVTSAGTIAGAAGLLTAIGIGAQFVPIVGTIIGGVALAIEALGLGNGCGGTCVEATQIANAASQALALNLQAAQAQAKANGGCLTQAEQDTAIANIQNIYQSVIQQCGQIPAPGGTQCIADRKAGGKYDIIAQNVPSIMDIPVCSGTASLFFGSGISSTDLLIGGIGLAALLFLL